MVVDSIGFYADSERVAIKGHEVAFEIVSLAVDVEGRARGGRSVRVGHRSSYSWAVLLVSGRESDERREWEQRGEVMCCWCWSW